MIGAGNGLPHSGVMREQGGDLILPDRPDRGVWVEQG